MSNLNLSSSHLASISHDPMEDEIAANRRPMRESRRQAMAATMQAPSPSSMLRPLLIAGAVGLFAAWVASGLNASPRPVRGRWRRHQHRAGGYVADREDIRPPRSSRRDWENRPEGRTSREDLSLDAMNP